MILRPYASLGHGARPRGVQTPHNAAAWHLRKRARSAHHLIEVGADGVVRARGGSGLYEEGEAFLGHLGLGEEWGEPLTSFRAVALPASAGSCIGAC